MYTFDGMVDEDVIGSHTPFHTESRKLSPLLAHKMIWMWVHTFSQPPYEEHKGIFSPSPRLYRSKPS